MDTLKNMNVPTLISIFIAFIVGLYFFIHWQTKELIKNEFKIRNKKKLILKKKQNKIIDNENINENQNIHTNNNVISSQNNVEIENNDDFGTIDMDSYIDPIDN
jgi:uncharacterized membrane protein YgaE (UPF0421/DUF939 family)